MDSGIARTTMRMREQSASASLFQPTCEVIDRIVKRRSIGSKDVRAFVHALRTHQHRMVGGCGCDEIERRRDHELQRAHASSHASAGRIRSSVVVVDCLAAPSPEICRLNPRLRADSIQQRVGPFMLPDALKRMSPGPGEASDKSDKGLVGARLLVHDNYLIALSKSVASPGNRTLLTGAGEGNRTLVCSLGSCRSTIELRPRMRVSRPF